MRTPSRWFTRRAQHLFPFDSSRTVLTRRTFQNVRFLLAVPSCLPRHQPCQSFAFTRNLRADKAEFDIFIDAAEVLTPPATTGFRDVKKIEKLSKWMSQLNRQLPAELQILETGLPRGIDNELPSAFNVKKIEKIFVLARSEADAEVLSWLVENGYRKTAVWLMNTILNLSGSTKKDSTIKAPSNIDWPQNLFSKLRRGPLKTLPTFHTTTEHVDDDGLFEPAQFDNRESQALSRLLGRVWESLGILIVNSAHAGTDDTMDDNMLTALLVLAHVHNLGMMPDNIYTYQHSDQPTHAQRPPILNLVSSRILAALSDVTWRQQQDDAISQATRMGMSLSEISKDAPGGRFRLKVRPLPPEIWLELILWCCIESDQVHPALAIIKKLSAQTEDPWFAIRWTSAQSREKLSALVDWDRVKRRHGGPAGLIEGYSREKPFVDVPDKTISVEVILALIEKLLASIASSSVTTMSHMGAHSIHKDFRSLQKTMSNIEDVMIFLEPHGLGPDYLDYLESRLLHDGVFDLSHAPADLYMWTSRMRSIRNLEKTDGERPADQTLRLCEVLAQSQLHIGFQHQALNALVEFGDVHHTLAIFNEIQESIDQKKVTSIKTFLQQQQHQSATTQGTSVLPGKHDLEFTNCHGQLPYYKLAGLLNLITDANLVGLGRWLLYAEDVDGAAIPEQAWGLQCMTSSIYRFAAVSQDQNLLEAAMAKRPATIMSSVKMLRSLADVNISLQDLGRALEILEELRTAQGGGIGLSNVAHLAAMILRVEQQVRSLPSGANARVLRRAEEVMDSMLLAGAYNSTRGDFTLEAQHIFKQQVHHILTVLSSFDGYRIKEYAKRVVANYPTSNLPVLPAKIFNLLLLADVELHGASHGIQMWHRWCKTPDTPYAVEPFDVESLVDDADNDNIEPNFMNESSSSRNLTVPLTSTTEASSQHDQLDSVEEFTQTTKVFSLPGQLNSDEELIEFEDPFFPKRQPDLVQGMELPPREQGADVSLPFETRERKTARSPRSDHFPLVVPNLATVRIIVRAIARELKTREEAGLGTDLQKEQLAWAVEIFKKFGIFDRSVIEQEIEHPLSELDAKMLQEARKAIEAHKDRIASHIEQDLSADSPVSEMWIPTSVLPKFEVGY